MSTPIYTPDGFAYVYTADNGVDVWRDTDGTYWSTSFEDPRPLPCVFGPFRPVDRSRRGKTIAR